MGRLAMNKLADIPLVDLLQRSVRLSSFSTGAFARFVSQPSKSILFGSTLLVGSLLDGRGDTSACVSSRWS